MSNNKNRDFNEQTNDKKLKLPLEKKNKIKAIKELLEIEDTLDEASSPIKDKEVNLLISSLDKPEYRFDFLKVFNLFRTKGLCEFPQREFEFTKKIFLFIAEKIKEETDVLSSKLILILAQTFYTKENDEKIYLFKYLKNHEMFLNLEVWDKYLASSIEDDLTRAKVDVSNINLEVNDSNKSVVINNVLIAHLFSFSNSFTNSSLYPLSSFL